VKYCLFILLAGGLARAQSDTATYITDINGRRVEVSSAAATDSERKELSQSINGRQVPLEQTETRVLSKGPNQTITETITRKFDRTGQVISTDRTVQDEQKHGNTSTIRATIYRSDINGRLQEDERRVIDTQTQGQTTTSDVVISRAGASGSFEPVEKRTVVTTGDAKSTHEQQFIYRPSQSGQLVEAQRMVKDQQKTGNTTVENAAAYELDYTGAMQLASQTTSTTTKVNDTADVTETNVYERASLGRPRVEGTGPRIDEQRIIERTKRPNGSVIETIAVRRPTLADPTHLGNPNKISETVCTGKCEGPAANAAATQPQAQAQAGARP
jgi:hypothetical protein